MMLAWILSIAFPFLVGVMVGALLFWGFLTLALRRNTCDPNG